MAGLPKGLLKSLIKEGYDPPEAMKEAWRIVGVQKKRYGARMSHGGGYPLGYKGRNPAQSLSEWETKWERRTELHKSGARYFPGANRLKRSEEKELYQLSDFVVSSNVAGTIWLVPRKNPRRQKARKNPIAFYNPSGGTLIYGNVLELRAVKTSGPHRGERYCHKFGRNVQAIGLPNGSVLLKSNNGAKLWKQI